MPLGDGGRGFHADRVILDEVHLTEHNIGAHGGDRVDDQELRDHFQEIVEEKRKKMAARLRKRIIDLLDAPRSPDWVVFYDPASSWLVGTDPEPGAMLIPIVNKKEVVGVAIDPARKGDEVPVVLRNEDGTVTPLGNTRVVNIEELANRGDSAKSVNAVLKERFEARKDLASRLRSRLGL